ncbi:hypothetical protein WNY37_05995 [Henriciella sp. AS95]|uniref:hypothetical protein n=1 Tax=Henriciella sp. AS95 TaxID=3135782 RepID=UPI00317879CF
MNQSLTDDLSYLRDLAESGQTAPLLGGRFLAWWGGLVTIAYLAHYAIAADVFGLPDTAFAWMWGAFGVIGFGGFKIMQATFPKSKPGASSVGNQISAVIWMAGGMVLFSFFAGVIIRSIMEGQASIGFLWSVPLVLGIYGICQLTSGLLAKSRPLMIAGWGAIASSGVAAIFTGSNTVWLVGAVVAALTVFLPGLILMRQEPSEVV